MKLDVSGAEGNVKECYKAFEDYVKALHAVVTDQLPGMIKEAELLTDKAERAKDHAEHEFESLGALKKAQAVLSFAVNLKYCAKIPTFFKKAALALKEDLEEIKITAENIKENGEKFKENGLVCMKAGLKLPVECNRKIDGPIYYTPATRSEWEKFMTTRAQGRWPRETFNPLEYPKTDMKDAV
jgi:hypothetical protein